MIERDPLLALPGLIDEPIAPRSAFADELRARLLTELGSHRRPAIDEERTMEITTPGLQLVLPDARSRWLPNRRTLAELAAVLVLIFGLIAVFASERAGSPPPADPTGQANLGFYPPSFATPDPGTVVTKSDSALLWQTDRVEDVFFVGDAAVGDGTFYRIIMSVEFRGVEAIDAASGTTKWRYATQGTELAADEHGVYVTFGNYSASAFSLGATPRALVVGPNDASVIALDPDSGDLLWSVNTGSGASSPTLSNGTLYFLESLSSLNVPRGTTQEATAIDTRNGSVIWTKTLGAPSGQGVLTTASMQSPVRLVVGDSTLVAMLGNGSLAGLDRISGETLWEHKGFDPLNYTLDLRVSESTVIASIYTGGKPGLRLDDFPNLQSNSAVIAYSIDDGTPLWGYDTGDMPSNLAVADGIAVVRAAPSAVPLTATPTLSEAGRSQFSYVIVGIDVATGEYAWTYGGGTAPNEEDWPSVVQDPGSPTIYVLQPSGHSFEVVDPGTGQSAQSPLSFLTKIVGAPLDANGIAYVQLKNGAIVASVLPVPPTQTIEEQIESAMPETGNPLPANVAWSVEQGTPWPRETLGFGLDQMVVADGHIYRTSIVINDLENEDVDKVLEAYDEQTGALLWQQPVTWPGTFRVDDSLAAGDGSVFVVENTSEDPNSAITSWDLVAFDGTSGEEQWRQSFTNGNPTRFDPESDQGIAVLSYLDGVLYTANDNSVVKAFDPKTGEQRWVSAAPPNQLIERPGDSGESTVQGEVSEVDGYSPGGSEPSITKHEDRLYVVTTSGQIAVLNAEDGNSIGSADPGSTESTTKPVFAGNLMIVGNTEWQSSTDGVITLGQRGTLTAFDITDNYAIVWQKEVGRSADNVLLVNDALYVTVGVPGDITKTSVQRFDPRTGGVIWSRELPGGVIDLSGTTGPNSSIAAQAFSESVLYTLDPETGDVLQTSEHFPAISLEAGDNGQYLATLIDGTLAAIDPLPKSTAGALATPEATTPGD